MRKSVKRCFTTLYDFELQKDWFDSNYKHAFWDSLLYYAFDNLYDRLHSIFFDSTEELYSEVVGVSMYDVTEALAAREVLNFFSDEFEGEMPDSYYVNHPSWLKFTEIAKQIVAMMEENEKKYDFASDLADYYRELDEETPEDIRKKMYGDG